MESYQNIFKRKEKKYLLDESKYCTIMKHLEKMAVHDDYPVTTIRSLYFDTPTRFLIRRSMERPLFKEKLRVRTYGDVSDGNVFLELKKKYKGIVFKRRIALSDKEAAEYLINGVQPKCDSQILREIDAFLKQYSPIEPSMLIMCRRESFVLKENRDIRITFDNEILFRTTDLMLESHVYGTHLLSEGQRLMEIKTPESIPLWLSKLLSEEEIFSNRFSKYGKAYTYTLSHEGEYTYV